MPGKSEAQRQYARHLAARAAMAYRAGFPIDALSISDASASGSGIICDWKQLRTVYGDDEKLLRRAFAFVFIGTIVDRDAGDLISDSLQKELASDELSAADARQTAVQWNLAPALSETNSFAHAGYKLASRLLRSDSALIDALADELSATGTMDKEQLKSWLDSHAASLVIEDLESSWTF
jgi:hypothetical protein